MKTARYPVVILAAWALAAAAACGDDPPGERKVITVDGEEREYYVRLPAGYDGATPVPLVLALHGGGGTAVKMEKLTGLAETADAHGFIVVYPQGLRKSWNDGRPINKLKKKADDVKFFSELSKRLANDYAVDQGRIYATGISNGGFMSCRLAADLPEVFAAVCSVAAGVSEDLAQNHPLGGPVSLMLVNGTDDPLVPYDGGYVTLFGLKRGKILSAREGVGWWVKQLRCDVPPVKTELPDRDPDDGTTVRREDYRGPDGADAVLVTVEGGGHTWPSGWQYLNERLIGKTTRDVDNELIWEFFAAHPKVKTE